MIHRQLTARPGMTLLELMIVLLLLSFMISFVAATLLFTIRIQQADVKLFQNMARYNALANRFRSDVGDATTAPAELGVLRANPHCLLLQLRDGRSLIYHAVENGVERIELNADHEPTAAVVYLCGENKQIDFSQSQNGRLLTLRMREVEPRFQVKRETEIMAALTPH